MTTTAILALIALALALALSCELVNNCIMFHLLTTLPIKVAEQEIRSPSASMYVTLYVV